MAFGEACPSDHRALLFDISYSVIFGMRPPHLLAPKPRKLKNNDPRIVKKYTTQVRQAMRRTKFLQQLNEFKEKTKTSTWDNELVSECDTLQKENTFIRVLVESKLRKLKLGGVQWSPKLQSFRNHIELWRMVTKQRKREKISTKRIRRFMKKTGCREALQCNLEQAIKNLSTSFKDYKTAKKDAGMWRNEFLGSLEKAKAEKKGTTEALEKRLSHQIERQRRQARNVRRMLGKLGQGRVTQLFFTNAENERILCGTQEKMVKACVRENETRSSQSENMPPMTDPLYQDLGRYGETAEAQQILFGSYKYPSGVDPYAKELLEEMRMPTRVPQEGPVHTDIHIEEHTKGCTYQKLPLRNHQPLASWAHLGQHHPHRPQIPAYQSLRPKNQKASLQDPRLRKFLC